MSHLPNSDCAKVEEKKIVEYLLNLNHVQGGPKANFFLARGFRAVDWQAMEAALKVQGQQNLVTKVTQHAYGQRYQVDCYCPTPDGMNPCIRTVWELPSVEAAPRLLTAYPLSN